MKRDKYGRQQTIVVDLDGTLVEEKPFPGPIGDWLPGATKALKKFLEAGYAVEVHTCRLHSMSPNFKQTNGDWHDTFSQIRTKLNEAGLKQVSICLADKPPARYYIDDKAVRFDGNWPKIARKICG